MACQSPRLRRLRFVPPRSQVKTVIGVDPMAIATRSRVSPAARERAESFTACAQTIEYVYWNTIKKGLRVRSAGGSAIRADSGEHSEWWVLTGYDADAVGGVAGSHHGD